MSRCSGAIAAGSPTPARASTNARSARPRSPARASRSIATRPRAELGFERPAANSIDAVSDRDFALEFLAAAAIAAVHLSRLAEELVLWSTPQFAFVRMAEEFSSGSSIMPQKRNPDAAELVRAKTGRVIGGLNALLIVLKGLPLAYSKDLQEDKEPVFDAADSLALCLAAHGRYDRGHDGRSPRGSRPPPRSATPPRPISPTGWCGRWACRSAPPTAIAAQAVRRAEALGVGLERLETRRAAGDRAADHGRGAGGAERRARRSPRAPASAAPRRSGCARRSRRRGSGICDRRAELSRWSGG